MQRARQIRAQLRAGDVLPVIHSARAIGETNGVATHCREGKPEDDFRVQSSPVVFRKRAICTSFDPAATRWRKAVFRCDQPLRDGAPPIPMAHHNHTVGCGVLKPKEAAETLQKPRASDLVLLLFARTLFCRRAMRRHQSQKPVERACGRCCRDHPAGAPDSPNRCGCCEPSTSPADPPGASGGSSVSEPQNAHTSLCAPTQARTRRGWEGRVCSGRPRYRFLGS